MTRIICCSGEISWKIIRLQYQHRHQTSRGAQHDPIARAALVPRGGLARWPGQPATGSLAHQPVTGCAAPTLGVPAPDSDQGIQTSNRCRTRSTVGGIRHALRDSQEAGE